MQRIKQNFPQKKHVLICKLRYILSSRLCKHNWIKHSIHSPAPILRGWPDFYFFSFPCVKVTYVYFLWMSILSWRRKHERVTFAGIVEKGCCELRVSSFPRFISRSTFHKGAMPTVFKFTLQSFGTCLIQMKTKLKINNVFFKVTLLVFWNYVWPWMHN